MLTLTRPQRRALKQIYDRPQTPAESYRRFRRKVVPLLAGQGCVMIPWQGMWIGIETDGYAHT